MGVLGTYCFDGLNFSQASALFTDASLSTLATDGYYSQGGIVREQLEGVLLKANACGSCSISCGSGVSVSISQNGFFDINFDVGNSIGAVVAYFYMGNSIADGVLANYDSSDYNRLTAKGNNGTTLVDGTGANVDYAGIGNQGTGDPTYVGSDQADIIRAYTNTSTTPGQCNPGDAPENYSYSGNSYVAQGTLNPLTVTNDMCGRATTGSPVFTVVIPKTNTGVTSLNLKVSAPACGTFFSYELDCPDFLPSFSSSVAQFTTECDVNQNQTFHFSRNATGTGTPFTVDTNVIPEVGNFVFIDRNGATYLNDTSSIRYYVSGTISIGVRNGVVISTQECDNSSAVPKTMGPSSTSRASACDTTDTPNTVYFQNNVVDEGVTAYSDPAFNVPFIGDSGFYRLDDSAKTKAIQINSSGLIISPVFLCGSSVYKLSDCSSQLFFTVSNDFPAQLGDVMQYQVGTPGEGAVYCGTIVDLDPGGLADATLVNGLSYDCNDSVHCAQ